MGDLRAPAWSLGSAISRSESAIRPDGRPGTTSFSVVSPGPGSRGAATLGMVLRQETGLPLRAGVAGAVRAVLAITIRHRRLPRRAARRSWAMWQPAAALKDVAGTRGCRPQPARPPG
jgi:hypothetical protein